jgi:hypothetical protein
MLPQKRLEALQSKRALIAKQIDKEESSSSVDPTLIRHLKKQKLELKEIITGIRKDIVAH